MLQIGLKASAEAEVVYENTAAALGSGSVEVFSTPNMIALMEMASRDAVQPELAEGESTVGTKINVTHDAAIPIGFVVRAESELIEIDRRRLVFAVKAVCGDEVIGQGTHERFVVDMNKFMGKVNARMK